MKITITWILAAILALEMLFYFVVKEEKKKFPVFMLMFTVLLFVVWTLVMFVYPA